MTATITVPSRRFGALELPQEELIEFPEGLIGLGGSRYVVVRPDPDSPFGWLQSAEDPDLALPVCDPWEFFADFTLELSDAATEAAGLPADGSGVRVLVTVRTGADVRDFTANLRAPVVLHEGRGHQVLNEAADAVLRAPLFPGAEQRAA